MFAILALPIAEVIVVGSLLGVVGALAILGKRVFFAESLSHGTFPGALTHGLLWLAVAPAAMAACSVMYSPFFVLP